MMTIKEIKELVDNTLEAKGFKRNFPVRLNGRFSRTYGAVRLRGNKIYAMEFSSKFVAQAPDGVMRETVLHECAHAIVDLRYPNEFHNHDVIFNAVCAELGIVGRSYSPFIIKRRYNVYCPNCGLVASYDRKTKMVDYVKEGKCICRKCEAVVRLT